MTNKEFEYEIKQAIIKHFDEYIPDNEIDDTPHTFSPEFEKKMQILIDNIEKRKHISRKRLITCIIAAVIAASIASMSVSAIREAFINFITNIFETHTDVKVIENDNASLDLTDKYEITADISDYKLVKFSEDIFEREFVYENEHCTLYFTQYIKEYYDIAVNTEGYEMEEILVNGKEGFYIDMYRHYAKIITWVNGDYVFSVYITCDEEYNLDKNQIIEIANSVQKIE